MFFLRIEYYISQKYFLTLRHEEQLGEVYSLIISIIPFLVYSILAFSPNVNILSNKEKSVFKSNTLFY